MTNKTNSGLGSKTRYSVAMAALFATISLAPKALAQQSREVNNRNGIQHVMLISIDGMHALDYENCVTAGTCPTSLPLEKLV
jgi:hypothetical protein